MATQNNQEKRLLRGYPDLMEEIKFVLKACGNYHNGTRTEEVCNILIKKINKSGIKILNQKISK